jgi:hypothetical protein
MQQANSERERLALGCRTRDLSSVGFLYADEISDTSIEGRRKVVEKLERAARNLYDQARMPGPPWPYSRTYHAELLRITRREIAELEALEQRREAA